MKGQEYLDELQTKLEKSWPSDMAGMRDYQQELSGDYAYITGLLPMAKEGVIRKKYEYRLKRKETLTGLKQYEYKDVLDDYACEEIIFLERVEALQKIISKHLEGVITAISAEKALSYLAPSGGVTG